MSDEVKKESSFFSWCKLFRLPNLPTVPGDAIAGAAVISALGLGVLDFKDIFASAFSLVLFYMFGLVDNDVVDFDRDKISSADRPLPSGRISRKAAIIAQAVCFVSAFVFPIILKFDKMWYLTAGMLVVSILLYNRLKNPFLMGLCRALGVLSGMFSVFSVMPTLSQLLVISSVCAGWCLYIFSVTKLSEGEEVSSPGISKLRFLGGATTLLPFLAAGIMKGMIAMIGSLFTLVMWCIIVMPLGEEHTSAERKKAIGGSIRALLYMQIGFILIVPTKEFVACTCVLWLISRFMKRLVPEISGS
ncbi:MAG: UbiA family prenyltransferase [Kiritimatiellae bacterium]|nr:UbiA family prenyltransferase [Kiritimatiellia bacterium]